MNYIFLKKQLNKTPVVPMQEESFQRILEKVQDLYHNNAAMNNVVDSVFKDTKQIYFEAMQKSIIENALIQPDVKGRSEKKKEPDSNNSNKNERLDYSSPWSHSFHVAREYICKHLHLLHPAHIILLDLCQHSYGTDMNSRCIGEMLMIDFKRLKQAGPLDHHQIKNNVTIELEKSQDFIKNIWYTNFINIFMEKNQLKSVPSSQLESFYNSVNVLASNQLKDLLLRSINSWCDILRAENHLNVPVIRMELTFDDQKMQFYPSVITIRELLFSVVEKISTSLPNIQSVRGFINAENEIIETTVAEHFIKRAQDRLTDSLEFYLIEPRKHLQTYSRNFVLNFFF